MKLSRRNFIQRSAALAGVVALPSIVSSSIPLEKGKTFKKYRFKKNDVVLFQGDSITDMGRDRKNFKPNDARALGPGYCNHAAAGLLNKMPEKQLSVYSRGISGNKVYQLLDRWQKDCIDLKPNVLSILIGVNDYWHLRNGKYNGTIKTYEDDYRKLLTITKKQLPDTLIVIGEPYSIDGGSAIVDGWQEEFKAYRMVAKKMSREFNTLFIPYQSVYKEAIKYAPCTYWSPEGVHPTLAGAALMAEAWQKVVLG